MLTSKVETVEPVSKEAQEPAKVETVADKKNEKPSEEMILDALLREGKLSREQEDKILEMAVFIEQKRLKEKEMGLDVQNNYAEQFIDKLATSKDFSEDQKNVALDAAIEAECVELKIRKLRGISPTKTKNTKKDGPQNLNEDVMSAVIANEKNTR